MPPSGARYRTRPAPARARRRPREQLPVCPRGHRIAAAGRRQGPEPQRIPRQAEAESEPRQVPAREGWPAAAAQGARRRRRPEPWRRVVRALRGNRGYAATGAPPPPSIDLELLRVPAGLPSTLTLSLTLMVDTRDDVAQRGGERAPVLLPAYPRAASPRSAGGALARIDPRTDLVSTTRLRPSWIPGTLLVYKGHVWVADEGTATLRLDPRTLRGTAAHIRIPA